MELQTLPYVDFQPDALTVFDDVAQGVVEQEDIWISCYQVGESSVHGKVKLFKGDEGQVDVQAREGVEVQRTSHISFTVSAPALKIKSTSIRFPRHTIHPEYPQTALSAPLLINSLDISPNGTQIVYGGPDGYCQVQPASDGTNGAGKKKAVVLKGHVGDVLSTKWFPSGEVVLTSSSDTLLRIFSSGDGSNPRTLKGHKRAVTSTCILGVGRNILSSSKDGSIRLWDVSEGKCVTSMWSEGFTGIERICVADRSVLGDLEMKEAKILGGESVEDTQDKVVFAALSNGNFAVYDLASKQPIFGSIPHLPEISAIPASSRGGPIYAIAQYGTLIATGSSKGTIVIRDTKTLSADGGKALAVFRRTEGGINDLAFVPTNHGLPDLVIATASGLPCRVGFEEVEGGLKVYVVEEYAGWEPVPVEAVAVGRDGGVWFAGGEGGIKRY